MSKGRLRAIEASADDKMLSASMIQNKGLRGLEQAGQFHAVHMLTSCRFDDWRCVAYRKARNTTLAARQQDGRLEGAIKTRGIGYRLRAGGLLQEIGCCLDLQDAVLAFGTQAALVALGQG